MEFHGVKQTNRVILMKITSRERPQVLLNTVKKYIDLAANTIDMVWLFSFDEGDICSSLDFTRQLSDIKQGLNFVFVSGHSDGKIHAINRDIEKVSNWDILLNISDDQIPECKNYDDIIRRSMPDDLDSSLWFFDGAQNRINTQEIVGIAYYKRFGYIYNPLYKSFYCDNESTEVATRLGKLIKIEKCIIRHNHPAINKSIQEDALYKKNNSYWNQDQQTFNKRKLENFI